MERTVTVVMELLLVLAVPLLMFQQKDLLLSITVNQVSKDVILSSINQSNPTVLIQNKYVSPIIRLGLIYILCELVFKMQSTN